MGKGSLASSFDRLENCKFASQADLAFSPGVLPLTKTGLSIHLHMCNSGRKEGVV